MDNTRAIELIKGRLRECNNMCICCDSELTEALSMAIIALENERGIFHNRIHDDAIDTIGTVLYTTSLSIPICPYCKKPTRRQSGCAFTTEVYYPPTYDESGVNINPDRNTTRQQWTCLDCGKSFTTMNGVVQEVDDGTQ